MSNKIVYIGDRLPVEKVEMAYPVILDDDDRYLFPGARRAWLATVDFWDEYSWVFENAFWAIMDRGADVYYGATTVLLISYDKAKINGFPWARRFKGFLARKAEDAIRHVKDAWRWRKELYEE